MSLAERYRQARLARDPRFDGHFFVAVKSTQIFCRPICPAPHPKEQNVTYYSSAHEAISEGYRPCLRCRPDSAPGSYAWKGVNTTLERGLRLIRENTDSPIESLAERLGITARYFRKLFTEHMGVSPKQLQMYERLLFAKSMLHQTSLSVEEIAQACGFTSARRLQDNMQRHFRLTPSAIRQQRIKNNSALSLTLSYRPPYHWPQVRDFLKRRALPGMEEVTDNSYSRTINLQHGSGYFSAHHQVEQSAFSVSLQLSDPRDLMSAVAGIRRVLDLDADPATISAGLIESGVQSEMLVSGLRLPGTWTLFEAGCRAILGQQISVIAAVKLVSQLVEELGESLPPDDKGPVSKLFPDASTIADNDLNFLKIPSRRRETLKVLARWLVENPDTTDPQEWLSIPGIGPWTVAYVSMRGAAHPDIWLDTDLIIRQQIEKHTIAAEKAAPWRSYLTMQLWSTA